MGGGSTELRALSERIHHLRLDLAAVEVALKKVERALVLRGHRLQQLEEAVVGLQKAKPRPKKKAKKKAAD